MYSGTIVPLVTPCDDDGEVSEPSVARLVASLHTDVTALLPALSTGEGWALSDRQWEQMVIATRTHSQGLPVLAGIQLPTTAGVVARATRALAIGVDAIVVSTPTGPDVTQEQCYGHFADLRSAVNVPILVYNETAVSGNHLELDTLVRICGLPGIVGVKESSGDAALTRRLVDALPDVPVFEGWENLLFAAPGVAGMIGPLANLEPALCTAMLADPTATRQAAVDAACVRYGVLRDNWYQAVKAELVRRTILSSDRILAADSTAHDDE